MAIHGWNGPTGSDMTADLVSGKAFGHARWNPTEEQKAMLAKVEAAASQQGAIIEDREFGMDGYVKLTITPKADAGKTHAKRAYRTISPSGVLA